MVLKNFHQLSERIKLELELPCQLQPNSPVEWWRTAVSDHECSIFVDKLAKTLHRLEIKVFADDLKVYMKITINCDVSLL